MRNFWVVRDMDGGGDFVYIVNRKPYVEGFARVRGKFTYASLPYKNFIKIFDIKLNRGQIMALKVSEVRP